MCLLLRCVTVTIREMMSGSDAAVRRRKNVVAKQPAAEADDDADDVTITPSDDDVKTSRDRGDVSCLNCLNMVKGFLVVLVSRLHQPVDASSLAVFRLLFGMYALGQKVIFLVFAFLFVSDVFLFTRVFYY